MIDPAGTRIWCGQTADVAIRGITPVLLGPVLGCALRQRRRIVLHGAAVAVNGRAVVLLGARGAGKSTTALALVRQGAALLADDMTVLSEVHAPPRIESGDPRVRLRIDPVLDGGESKGESVRDDVWPPVEKMEIPLPAHRDGALPLAAIYVLGGREPEKITATVTLQPPTIAIASLMRNRYATFVLRPAGHARDFAALSNLAGQVPLYHVRRADRMESVPELAETILEHAGRVTHPPT